MPENTPFTKSSLSEDAHAPHKEDAAMQKEPAGTAAADSPFLQGETAQDSHNMHAASQAMGMPSAEQVLPNGAESTEKRRRFFQRKEKQFNKKENLFTRCLLVFGITLLLMIVLSFFDDLVSERSYLHDDAIGNITASWGTKQTIRGPVLLIPYTLEEDEGLPYNFAPQRRNGDTDTEKKVQYMVVLPKKFDVSATINPDIRYRGIYKYTVYSAPVSMQGAYYLPEFDKRHKMQWENAFLCMTVSDLKAITSIEPLTWNGRGGIAFDAGTQGISFLGEGFHAKVRIAPEQREYTFATNMTLNGSEGIYVTPVGEQSTLSLSGKWPSPNFDSAVLPVKRTITPEGFSANWIVPHLSRTYPQSAPLEVYESHEMRRTLGSFTTGVSLYEDMPLYRLVTRAMKYAGLFIGLTFVGLLVFELISRTRLHLVQYGLVGVAMTLFYLILLSLAEHVAFAIAFAVATAVIVGMNGLYIASVLQSKGKGLLMAVLLGLLYTVLYFLLQVEEYAIVGGTTLIVVVVCALMYLTRNLRGTESVSTTSEKKGRE